MFCLTESARSEPKIVLFLGSDQENSVKNTNNPMSSFGSIEKDIELSLRIYVLGCFKSAKKFICQKVQHFQADSESLG